MTRGAWPIWHARRELRELEQALEGFFTEHHARLLRMMLDNVNRMDAQIAALDRAIEEAVAPFSHQVAQLRGVHDESGYVTES